MSCPTFRLPIGFGLLAASAAVAALAAVSGCEGDTHIVGERDDGGAGHGDSGGSGGKTGSGGHVGTGGGPGAGGGAAGSGGNVVGGGTGGSGSGGLASGGATGAGGRGTGGATGTGGVGSGGTTGTGGVGSGGAAGTGGCAVGQVWCPGCTPGTGICTAGVCTGAPCPVVCTDVTTRQACDARTDCHSVFVDPNNCSCPAAGCCATFSRCAAGGQAICGATGIGCTIATPHCEGSYAISIVNACFEGCVDISECAACSPSFETPPIVSGICDGKGQGLCQMWAAENVIAGTATAYCTDSGCVRADKCTSLSDPSTCTCGTGPACPPGAVCAAAGPGAVPSCRCAIRHN